MPKVDKNSMKIVKYAIILNLVLYPSLLITSPYDNHLVQAKENTPQENLTIQVGDFTLQILNDTQAEILSYNQTKEIPFENIPNKINEYEILGIGDNAFENLVTKEITIPDTINYVGNNAFLNASIEKVTLSMNKDTKYGTGAFKGLQATYFYIPCEMNVIPERFFEDSNVKIAEMPDTLSDIGKYSFSNSEFENISFPKTIKKIEYGAFSGSNLNLKDTFELKDNMIIEDFSFYNTKMKGNLSLDNLSKNSLGMSVFKNFSLVGNLSIQNTENLNENDNSNYLFENAKVDGEVSFKGQNTTIPDYTFVNSNLTDLKLTGDFKEIGEFSFHNSKLNLNKNITFKAEIERIKSNAFSDLNMENIIFEGDIDVIEPFAFNNVKLDNFILNGNLGNIRFKSFYDTFIKNMHIKGYLNHMSNGAFYYSKENRNDDFIMDSFTVDGNIKSFGNEINYNHLSISRNPDDVKQFGDYMYSINDKILPKVKRFVVNGNIDYIGSSALDNNVEESININGNILDIGNGAFSQYSENVNRDRIININGDIGFVGEMAFNGNYNQIIVTGSIGEVSINGLTSENLDYIDVKEGIRIIGYNGLANINMNSKKEIQFNNNLLKNN